MTFREFVHNERFKRNMNMKDLARVARVRYMLVQQLESGVRKSLPKIVSDNLIKALGGSLPSDVEPIPETPPSGRMKPLSREQKLKKQHKAKFSVTVYESLVLPNWFDGAQDVFLNTLQGRFGLDFVEPLIRNGCFKFQQPAPPTIVGVEFEDKIIAPDLPYYFDQQNLRFVDFGELLFFGAAHPEVVGEKTVVQYGSQFKEGFTSEDHNISGAVNHAIGGHAVGAAFHLHAEVGKSLCFYSYRSLFTMLLDSYSAQQPKIGSGTIVLGVPKKKSESIFPHKGYDNTLAVMQRAGLDEAFNDQLFERARKKAERVGQTLADTQGIRRVLLNAYHTNTEYDLFSGLGYYPEPEAKAG